MRGKKQGIPYRRVSTLKVRLDGKKIALGKYFKVKRPVKNAPQVLFNYINKTQPILGLVNYPV